MKKLITTLTILLLISTTTFSQFGSDAASYGSPAEYTPRNAGLENEYYKTLLEMKAREGEMMEAKYNSNKDYRDKLIDWIFKLKAQASEKEFLDAMDIYYKQLRDIEGQDLLYAANKLDNIKFNIKEEIDKYSTRQKELPKKLWESGNTNLKNKNYSSAIKDYTDLIALSPDFVSTYRNRGIAYQAIGQYSLSIGDENKYIEATPNDAFAYSTRGWSKYYQKDYMGSLADFNKQIELEPNSAFAYYNRGSAKSELKDEYGAIADYSKAIELKSDYSMAYNNRGWSKYELKKYKEAITDLDKAIIIDNTNYVAYDSRQETKFMSNDLKGCIEDCNSAIALNPKLSNSYLFRGRAFYKQGNKQKACEDWSKAGELGKAEAYDFISKYCK